MGVRHVALVTGASRRIGIGAAVARQLAVDGWDVAVTFWRPYDERMPWGSDDNATELVDELVTLGARSVSIEADLSRSEVPDAVVDRVAGELGPIRALVQCHCDGVDAGIPDTTIDDFDRVFAVNARATWLLIRSFAAQFRDTHGSGRVIAFTSDHTAGNLAYGASKGALDRIVLASAIEFAALGITANVINPGPTNTGWMSDELHDAVKRSTPLDRVGQPEDAARLAAFLCSDDGGWVNGQLLHSDGGHGLT